MKLFKYTNACLLMITAAMLTACVSTNDEKLTEDPLGLAYTDTLSLEAQVMRDDTLRGDGKDFVPLGVYYDPIFGTVNASFYTSFGMSLPSISTSVYNSVVVDSVVLSIQFIGSYGNANKLKGFLEMDVYEVTQTMDIPAAGSTGYSTGKNFAVNPTPVGSFSTSPIILPTGNVSVVNVKLDNSIGTRLMSLDSLTTAKVQNELKGLYLKVKPSFAQAIAPGFGSVLYFSLTNTSTAVSKLSVHIHHVPNGASSPVKNELWFSPSVIARTVRVNHFEHDYANTADADLNTKLNNPTDTTVKNLYIQAGAGLRVLMKVPFITNLPTSDSTVIVNEAKLIIPVEENSGEDLFLPPQQLYAYINNNDPSGSGNTANWVEDYANSWFNGKYDPTKKEYTMLITKYLNKVATGRLPNNGFFIDVAPLAKATSVNRVVLNGPNHPTRPMKLEVLYSKIKK